MSNIKIKKNLDTRAGNVWQVHINEKEEGIDASEGRVFLSGLKDEVLLAGATEILLNEIDLGVLEDLKKLVPSSIADTVFLAWYLCVEQNHQHAIEIGFNATAIGGPNGITKKPFRARLHLRSGEVECISFPDDKGDYSCIILDHHDYPAEDGVLAIKTIRRYSKLLVPSNCLTNI